MNKVETIIDKIEEIKVSKAKIINALLKNGTEVSKDTPLKEIPDIIVETNTHIDSILGDIKSALEAL